jgi:hypothetical protein
MRMLFLSALVTVGLCILIVRSTGEPYVAVVLSEIKQIHRDQVDFYARHGRYATSLEELSPEMARSQRFAYRLTVEGRGNSYIIHAEPVRPPGTDRLTFYSDETMVIRKSRRELATADSEPLK